MLGMVFVIIVSAIVMLFIIGGISSWANSPTPEQLAEKERKKELRKAIALEKSNWLAEINATLKYATAGTLVGGIGQGRCVLAFDEAQRSIRIFGYTTGQEFKVRLEANIPVSQIISLEVVRPMEMKRVQRTQAVGVVSTNKKSPVARGLAGGALIGPAGLVLGAASGASKDTTTEIKEHKVWEQVQREGDPELWVGTSDPGSPLIKVKPENSAAADEWLYRIKALQSQVDLA